MARTKKVTPDMVEIIIKEYQKGHTYKKIASMVGTISDNTVRRVLIKNNIPLREVDKNTSRFKREKAEIAKLPENYTGAIDCDTQGENCIYRSRTPNLNLCDYCAINGHSRGGNPHECTKYKIKERRKA